MSIDFRALAPRWLYFVTFTVSGFAGLIYESIWSHYLKLFLGHAALAQSLVLIIFMGGMAAGAWVASRYSNRWKMPLLAYAIVEAIIGVMALGGLNAVLDQQELASAQADRWSRIQFTVRMLTQDLSQIHPRGIRDGSGEELKPAIVADPGSAFPLEFSRGGWNNPAGLPRGTVQRVAYEIEDDKLYRLHWPMLDRTLGAAPLRNELLDQIERVELRFLSETGQWEPDWPPLGIAPGSALSLRPRAIEVTLYLQDLGKIWRLVEISG